MDELSLKYLRKGHPSAEELIAAQGLTFPLPVESLFGDFWPEDESIDDFLAALHDWRGHKRNDSAA